MNERRTGTFPATTFGAEPSTARREHARRDVALRELREQSFQLQLRAADDGSEALDRHGNAQLAYSIRAAAPHRCSD